MMFILRGVNWSNIHDFFSRREPKRAPDDNTDTNSNQNNGREFHLFFPFR